MNLGFPERKSVGWLFHRGIPVLIPCISRTGKIRVCLFHFPTFPLKHQEKKQVIPPQFSWGWVSFGLRHPEFRHVSAPPRSEDGEEVAFPLPPTSSWGASAQVAAAYGRTELAEDVLSCQACRFSAQNGAGWLNRPSDSLAF